MKHLIQSTLYGSKVRRFNESFNTENLKEFCEENLVALIDDNYHVIIHKKDDKSFYASLYLMEKNSQYYMSDSIEWNNIKDYYIPFIERLSKVYLIDNIINMIFIYYNFNDDRYAINQKISIDDLDNYFIKKPKFIPESEELCEKVEMVAIHVTVKDKI